MIAGEDPYAWKGTEELNKVWVRSRARAAASIPRQGPRRDVASGMKMG